MCTININDRTLTPSSVTNGLTDNFLNGCQKLVNIYMPAYYYTSLDNNMLHSKKYLQSKLVSNDLAGKKLKGPLNTDF